MDVGRAPQLVGYTLVAAFMCTFAMISIFTTLILHECGKLPAWLSASLDRLAGMHYMCIDGLINSMEYWGTVLLGIYPMFIDVGVLIMYPILAVPFCLITGFCWYLVDAALPSGLWGNRE
jgi:hypothetical protein